MDAEVKRVLEIRQQLSKSSTAKYQAFINGTDTDGRMRGTMMYHAASTGRWGGRRVQPQNMPREGIPDFEKAIGLIRDNNYQEIDMFYGDPIMVASKLIRNMIVPEDGNNLICADYASIEGRVLAWLAGEEYILDNYREGKDAYCVFASQIYGIDYETILNGYKNGDQKFIDIRFEGKTGELACGYQGGEKAVKNFAPDMPKERRKEIVHIWRASRPATKALWSNLGHAAVRAVREGTIETVGKIRFGVLNGFLYMRLPSGRNLAYYKPEIKEVQMYCYYLGDDSNGDPDFEYSSSNSKKDGERYPDKDFVTEAVQFWGVDSMTKKWEHQTTYGGKLSENATQAVARDILAEALLRVEEAEYPVVLHVHDEIISEIPEGFGSVEEFEKIMCELPTWADGLPIQAKGWRGKRYRK